MLKGLIFLFFIISISCNKNQLVSDKPLQDYTKNSISIVPFQPVPKDLSFISKILYSGEKNQFKFSLYGNNQKIVIHENIPFARYWQLKDQESYVFHPMVFARYLFHNTDKIPLIFSESQKFQTELPNEGIAFYYPEHYPLHRMIGPDIHYSAISQSEALGALMNAYTKNPSEYNKKLLEKILSGLLFQYNRGGVNLYNKALLEMPLFQSNPEIILNGWLHALLHLTDYVLLTKSEETQKILLENIRFLSSLLKDDVFYSKDLNISNYSETTPYQVKLSFENSLPKNIEILYIPKYKGLENLKKVISTKKTAIKYGALIGENSRIWHWVHICSKAKIGSKCSLGQNVFVGNSVIIGNNVKIQNNVSVYDNVTLEDDVFCGPSMVFTNVYNPRSAIERKNEYMSTLVKKGSTIGANATIVCGVTLGEYSFIAAGAVINKDVKPFALMAGVPAKQIGWMSCFGERISLPLEGQGEWSCPHTGERYELKHSDLIKR